jgi:hypothetical protein
MNSSPSLELDRECPQSPVAPAVAVRGKKMFKLVAAAAVGDHSSSLKRAADDSSSNTKNNTTTMDLVSPLPDDVLCRITSFLDARSLLQMRLINHSFHKQAARNAAGWDNLCQELWKDKIHVCAEAVHMRSHNRGHGSDSGNTGMATAAGSATAAQQQTAQDRNSNSNSKNNDNNNDSIHNSCLTAYKLSLQDSRNRHHVTRQELCYDPDTMTGTVWSFRFKESAGNDWTAQDPWYNGLPCRKMVFLPDGSVKQYIPVPVPVPATPTSPTPANTILATASTTHRTAQEIIREQVQQHQAQQHQAQQHQAQQPPPQQLFRDANLGHMHQRVPFLDAAAASAIASASANILGASVPTLVDPHMTMTWRFLTRPMDLPTRETGSYVRFSVGGRDVPTYSVRRSPVGNWGFVMESCWGIYASFELPPKHVVTTANQNDAAANASPNHSQHHHHRGAVRQERTRRRLRRTEDGAVWVDELEDEEEEEEDVNRHERNNIGQADAAVSNARERARIEGEASLRDDASLLITNEIQWREAFLYNVGARVLPEGDEAADEFDRAWGGL